jgi:hypothetical protein
MIILFQLPEEVTQFVTRVDFESSGFRGRAHFARDIGQSLFLQAP